MDIPPLCVGQQIEQLFSLVADLPVRIDLPVVSSPCSSSRFCTRMLDFGAVGPVGITGGDSLATRGLRAAAVDEPPRKAQAQALLRPLEQAALEPPRRVPKRRRRSPISVSASVSISGVACAALAALALCASRLRLRLRSLYSFLLRLRVPLGIVLGFLPSLPHSLVFRHVSL